MTTSRALTLVGRWLTKADPGSLLYGAIISAAVLGAVSLHEDTAWRVAVATGVVLVIYWMADVYVHALSVRFDGDARSLLHRLRLAAGHKVGVIRGGLPAIAVYLFAYTLGADSSSAAFIALWFSIGLLVVVGFLGARQAGSTGRAAVLEGLGAGFLGVLVVVAKSLLH